MKQTKKVLKLSYPKVGIKYNPDRKELEPVALPTSPKGMSGGPCFGVAKRQHAVVESIQYNLVGIQYEWHQGERWMKAVRIKQWRKLIAKHYGE